MWAFVELVKFSFSSIFWGLLIAVVCMALFFAAIKGWWKNAMFTPATYIVGAVLFILLTFQCILICGGIKIINITDAIQLETERIINENFLPGDLSMADADDVTKTLVRDYPVLGHYFNTGYFEGVTTETLPAAMADAVRDYMKGFIIRRLLWCLGFVVVGAVLAIKTISLQNSMRRSRTDTRPVNRTANNQRLSRSNRPRVGRRR